MKLVLFKAYGHRGTIDAICFWDGNYNIRDVFISFVSKVTFGEFDEIKIMSEDKLKEFLNKNCDREICDTEPFDGISPDFDFSIIPETYKDDLIFLFR